MKHSNVPTSGQQAPRGIIRGSKGIAITVIGLPMADHFFQATGYRLKRVGSNLHMVFGAQTAFAEDSDAEYRLAIEIVYPVEMAAKYIYLLNWKHRSASSKDPFANILEKIVEPQAKSHMPSKAYKIPSGASFRSFPSNFSIMSVSTGQASIEFFEAAPGMLVEALFQKNGWRPNSDVRAILTVILPPIELYNFLRETKELLEGIPASLDEDAEEDHV